MRFVTVATPVGICGRPWCRRRAESDGAVETFAPTGLRAGQHGAADVEGEVDLRIGTHALAAEAAERRLRGGQAHEDGRGGDRGATQDRSRWAGTGESELSPQARAAPLADHERRERDGERDGDEAGPGCEEHECGDHAPASVPRPGGLRARGHGQPAAGAVLL